MAAIEGHTGRLFHGEGYYLVVNRQSLDIELSTAEKDIEIPLDLVTGMANPVSVTVTRAIAPFSPTLCDGKQVVAFNKRLLDCSRIVLRHWRRGDRMRPFGLKGTKLLSDLFADLKMSHEEKQTTWILEADGEILWVLGRRASALYPVTPGSQDYLLLQH